MAPTLGNVRRGATTQQRGALAQRPHLSALPTSPVPALPPQMTNDEPWMEPTAAAKPALAPKPAMPPHPCAPPDLTAAAIAGAKGAKLRHWIDQANQQATGGKRVLKKAGCINELRERLAQYYGLELNSSPAKTELQVTSNAPPPAAHSPSGNPVPAINADIQWRQWEHLVALGDEWAIAGDSFKLCQQPLSPTCNPETIHALLLAAKSGDMNAAATLQGLSGATATPAKPEPALGHHIPLPTSQSTPSTSAPDAAILASGKMDVEALERAANLVDVIDQLERGDVRCMREKYGPQPGRPHNLLWTKIKVTICRHECLHQQLTNPREFNGDKQHFLDFFASAPRRPSKRTHAGKEKAGEQYPPFRLLVEAIPHCDRDIAEEKAKPQYLGEEGAFSRQPGMVHGKAAMTGKSGGHWGKSATNY
jgi:hypothetical protein